MTLETSSNGCLHIVATPIGNLDDMSPRAIATLQSADYVLAEDTRRYRTLATRFSIQTDARSFHDHNEAKQLERALEDLRDGKSIALISDAGTPLISDPGFLLVRACRAESISVIGIPGPCAAITALSISGLPAHAFTFLGFLPNKEGKRKKMLEAALETDHSTIFYESPHRIVKSLKALAELAPQHQVCVARELTKQFEEVSVGTAEEVFQSYNERQSVKGEFVLIVSSGK